MKSLFVLIALVFSFEATAQGSLAQAEFGKFTLPSDSSAKELLPASEKEFRVDYDRIWLQNLCHEDLRVYLVYEKLDGSWDTELGYYSIRSGQRAPVAYTRNGIYYFSAISVSGSYVWRGEKIVTMNDGSQWSMIEGRITSSTYGDWTQQFSCR